ncbi:NADAR family protein [Glycomyces buryatensis]|uniref:NADAR family protein n=1 Tax=Glycomyces buryatensis TaxID=2570927 RepID=A0A4S8QM95_9ACTN|nr:NADAR family protein [Glycomyces buryatensis]THV42539.1 NADAR family protein [Glycomyces buryatensis]
MSNTVELPRTAAEAVALEATGRSFKYLCFWGHADDRGGEVGRGCLSQWWPGKFTEDGHRFATAEHYMMAHKAWLFGDAAIAERILAAGHPAQAQKLGRQVRGFDQAIWEAERFDIVVRGNIAKFGQHAEALAFLLATRNRVLVEASPRDRIWGIGLAEDDPKASRPRTWRGLNLLGFALMEARTRLNS